MKTIHERIVNHRTVYESMGFEVPSYRITCKEHKELVLQLKKNIPHSVTDQTGMIGQYYGIDLEVVMACDEYF